MDFLIGFTCQVTEHKSGAETHFIKKDLGCISRVSIAKQVVQEVGKKKKERDDFEKRMKLNSIIILVSQECVLVADGAKLWIGYSFGNGV